MARPSSRSATSAGNAKKRWRRMRSRAPAAPRRALSPPHDRRLDRGFGAPHAGGPAAPAAARVEPLRAKRRHRACAARARVKRGSRLLGSSAKAMRPLRNVATSRALGISSSGRTSANVAALRMRAIRARCRAMRADAGEPLPRASRISTVSAWSSSVCAVSTQRRRLCARPPRAAAIARGARRLLQAGARLLAASSAGFGAEP